jgi:hypothetical protein
MSDFQGKVNFIWSVADELLSHDFKRLRSPDVILPFTVLRRVNARVTSSCLGWATAPLMNFKAGS